MKKPIIKRRTLFRSLKIIIIIPGCVQIHYFRLCAHNSNHRQVIFSPKKKRNKIAVIIKFSRIYWSFQVKWWWLLLSCWRQSVVSCESKFVIFDFLFFFSFDYNHDDDFFFWKKKTKNYPIDYYDYYKLFFISLSFHNIFDFNNNDHKNCIT